MWSFLGALVGFIWDGVQIAYQAIVTFLEWSVQLLWVFATSLYNGLILLGQTILTALTKVWGFFKTIYEDVLKPAWQKFWKLFDKVQKWLKDTFTPILNFLKSVRDELLCLYKTWIRPVLDVIDATRGILRVLEALHVPFAQAIDNALGAVETWVNEQFQKILKPLNEIIGLVNRVVTADGLFQRVAHIRTLQRDILYASRVFTNARTRHLTYEENVKISHSAKTRSVPEINLDLGRYFETGDAEITPLLEAAAAEWGALFEAA